MRKTGGWILAGVLALSGCSSSSDVDTDAQKYEAYYQTVLTNDTWMDGSLYFSLSAEMSQVEDGSYRYYIFLDDAQIAMYQIAMIAVENDTPYGQGDKMMPNIGIMGSSTYTMIPNQAAPELGFVKGLVISGESEDPSLDLKVLVEWKDKSLDRVSRAFIAFTLDESGWVSSSEPSFSNLSEADAAAGAEATAEASESSAAESTVPSEESN
jgi:hypothetical protein